MDLRAVGPLVALVALSLASGAAQEQLVAPAERGDAVRGPSPVRFEEVGAARGIVGHGRLIPRQGAGAAAADYDDDGDVDLFVPRPAGVHDRLYRNDGSGQYEDVAGDLGLDSLAGNRVALWFDPDGDHDLDLVVGNDTDNLVTSLHYHRQVTPAFFVEATAEAGLQAVLQTSSDTHRGGMCAGDLDNDGYLELYVASWLGQQYLFHNDGAGGFTDVSESSGIGGPVAAGGPKWGWQPTMVDVDGDGWLDVYAAIDFTANRLWMNRRDMTFVDRAPLAGCDLLMNDMGNCVLDFDDDGDFDLHTTNVFDGIGYNALLRRSPFERGLRYEDVSLDTGVADGGWGWGVTALDADRDGVLEIAATNGWIQLDTTRLWRREPGSLAFADIAAQAGVDDDLWGSALLSFDSDRDGDVDLFQVAMEGHLRLLENRMTEDRAGGHWLVVRPRMAGPNHRAIGAVVRVVVGQHRMTRLIGAGTSFLGQEPAEAFFGLGAASTANRVVVLFPGGDRKVLHDVAADRVLDVLAGT